MKPRPVDTPEPTDYTMLKKLMSYIQHLINIQYPRAFFNIYIQNYATTFKLRKNENNEAAYLHNKRLAKYFHWQSNRGQQTAWNHKDRVTLRDLLYASVALSQKEVKKCESVAIYKAGEHYKHIFVYKNVRSRVLVITCAIYRKLEKKIMTKLYQYIF